MSSYLVEQILSFAEFSLEKLRGLRRGGRGLEGCCCVYQSNCWSDQAADIGQFQPDSGRTGTFLILPEGKLTWSWTGANMTD